MSVHIDAQHTSVIVEHWDKDQVVIEAQLDSGNLPPEEVKNNSNSEFGNLRGCRRGAYKLGRWSLLEPGN